MGADVVEKAEGSTKVPRWPGAEVPPGSESRACPQRGSPGTWEACATKAEGGIDVEDRPYEAGCIRDGGWPSGAALQGEAPNHRELRRSRAGVVSVAEKAHQQCVRYEPRRRTRVNH